MSDVISAKFFAIGGAVPLQSPSYCTRDADEELYTRFLQGEFCYILSTRQIGKTSLIARTARRLRNDGIDAVSLDLTQCGTADNKEQWYYTLLNQIGDQVNLHQELRTLWTSDLQLTPLQRWQNGIRMILLARPARRLVILIDEIDNVRALPFKTWEFFAAIRACYNRRTENTEFNRLTFCLIGVATPSDLIDDMRMTPFNIGRRIELTDFTPEEAASLAVGLDVKQQVLSSVVPPTSDAQHLLARILYWTDGHPYLTQRLCAAVAETTLHPKSKIQNRKLIVSASTCFCHRRRRSRMPT
jgi:hypothetical protein